jgi:hypothetical protein
MRGDVENSKARATKASATASPRETRTEGAIDDANESAHRRGSEIDDDGEEANGPLSAGSSVVTTTTKLRPLGPFAGAPRAQSAGVPQGVRRNAPLGSRRRRRRMRGDVENWSATATKASANANTKETRAEGAIEHASDHVIDANKGANESAIDAANKGANESANESAHRRGGESDTDREEANGALWITTTTAGRRPTARRRGRRRRRRW